MVLNWLSPAQCVGYIAFVFGIATFLQRDDRRLKILNACECVAYVAHFLMMGSTAWASSVVSGLRSVTSLKFNSRWLAFFFMALNIAVGFVLVRTPAGWLPVIGSCLAAWGMFTMQGLPMRVVMLACTLCWLANNILLHSIGGTALETGIATVSLYTIISMWREQKARELSTEAAAVIGD